MSQKSCSECGVTIIDTEEPWFILTEISEDDETEYNVCSLKCLKELVLDSE